VLFFCRRSTCMLLAPAMDFLNSAKIYSCSWSQGSWR
jgi:hypothetical protein